jgi:Tfp pilus assembly protein PilP
MPRIHTLFAAIAIAVTACGTQQTPPARRTPAPVAAVEPRAAVQPAPGTDALYVYSPVDKRDPFKAPKLRQDDRPPTPLWEWPVDQFSLKITVTGTASPTAVIQDPGSRAWLVRIGDYVGNNSGKVTSIERDRMFVTEIIEGAGGRLFRKLLKLEIESPGNIERQDHMIDLPPGK